MDIPEKCPGKEDKIYMIINLIRLAISCVILYFLHWGFTIGFLIYWIVFIFIFFDRYLCNRCIYRLGKEVESIQEYNEKYGTEFKHRLMVSFPFLLIDWFFAIGIGIYIIIVDISLILIILPLIIIQFILTMYNLISTPKKHCPECLFREYCPVSKK